MSSGPAHDALPDEDRERLTQLLTNAMARGLLAEDEYVHRLGLLHDATDLDDATRIVQEMPILIPTAPKASKSQKKGGDGQAPSAAPMAVPPPATDSHATAATPATPPPLPAAARPAAEPVPARPTGAEPDPVDLLRMARSVSTAKSGPDNRWKALVVIMAMFLVLMILGAVLLSKVHANQNNKTTTTGMRVPALSRPLPGDLRT